MASRSLDCQDNDPCHVVDVSDDTGNQRSHELFMRACSPTAKFRPWVASSTVFRRPVGLRVPDAAQMVNLTARPNDAIVPLKLVRLLARVPLDSPGLRDVAHLVGQLRHIQLAPCYLAFDDLSFSRTIRCCTRAIPDRCESEKAIAVAHSP